LDYSNDLYEKGAAPQHPESVAAFARWAGAAAKHFANRRILWEIWNEPNISFWKPKPDVHQYIALARATCQAVRENDPRATILAPASSEFPWEFFEEMFKAGLLAELDAVSVHPYRSYDRGPETAMEDYLKLRALIERYAPPAKKAMPIISGEWGYASHRKGVSPETQAAFAVRQQLSNLLNGVPLSIWYDWKNDGVDPDEGEHNFGTVFPDLQPKPAYQAMQTMTRELTGYRIAHRLETDAPDAWVLLLVNAAGEQKLAAWSTRGEQTLNLDAGLSSPSAVALVDGNGKPGTARLDGSRIQLSLSALPVYVTFKERSPVLAAAAAWQIREPFARSIECGRKDGLTLTVAVRNPFPHPISVQASLAGPGVADGKTVKVGPGKSADVTLNCSVSRRDLPNIPVALTIQMKDAAGKLVGNGSESLLFQVANPLRMTLAPVEKGLQVSLDNVSGAPFRGTLQAGNQKQPVALASGTASATLDFKMPAPAEDIIPEPVRLVGSDGKPVAEISATRFHPFSATNYLAALDGDSKIRATATIHAVSAPGENPPYSKVFALDYEFDEGWRFVRCEAGSTISFATRPTALGVWVYGDNSGNTLRVRVRDASGQTFQPNGPSLNWVGWRWVLFDLEHLANAGHWGGANDGMVKGDLTLDTPLLLDSTRNKHSGRIYFTGLTALSR
jgi:hypothetical protein